MLGYSTLELLITISITCLLVLIPFSFFHSFKFIFGSFEKDVVLSEMYLFKELTFLKRKEGRLILYDRNIEYNGLDDKRRIDLDWLKLDSKISEEKNEIGGGILKLNGEGFPSGAGSFIMRIDNKGWKITLTPVVGKVNLYFLK